MKALNSDAIVTLCLLATIGVLGLIVFLGSKLVVCTLVPIICLAAGVLGSFFYDRCDE